MSTPVAGNGEGIVDAATATDEEVRAALGVDPAGDDAPEDEAEDQGGEPELTLEGLAAQVEAMRVENARLKRENAQARVSAKKVGTAEPAADEAVATAREQAKAEARLEYGIKLAGSKVEAALASIMTEAQITAFVDDLNLAKYVDEDGEPDTEAIAALKARQTSLLGKRPAAKVGHGRTGTPTSTKVEDQFAEALSGAFK